MPTHFLHIIDILGTIAFAVSGAFLAMEKKLDPFGVLVLAFVTAIGGGTLRDILIGNLPVSWLRNETASIVIFSAAVVTMLFGRYLKKFTTTLFLFDALGLGLFTLVGIKLGIEKDFSVGICITLGTITACFGGVVRDVLLNNIPLLFRKEIYAMACIAGGAVYFLLREMNIDPDLSTILGILIIFVIRIIAVRYKLFLPQFYTSTIQK
ncbi:MAG: trimeric intracellular cation channel family protein [Chitinophagaceae bacterium]|nr:trimeric intracellular cation channel family protein [Chitinophagaceae bacterium]MBP6215113.1 trimeric intracellular cation channel family protein [Chitinophagaceae bacterium]HQV61222.1 trimeric intracellular cation channel family protein [Chitinophagaceae bacterium]HQV87213.1 trimeric intracellular cation channel family protein [Chitinophagaceae bacterium]HQX71876.1 trimeric intracellular cation channel family protein [Chitinophagaceae bacterium]